MVGVKSEQVEAEGERGGRRYGQDYQGRQPRQRLVEDQERVYRVDRVVNGDSPGVDPGKVEAVAGQGSAGAFNEGAEEAGSAVAG